MTTVLVTHDQEEAMDVADRIARRITGGRADRRPARALRAAGERVREGFVGPVATVGERACFARTTSTSPRAPAMVSRVDHRLEVRMSCR